MEREEGREEKGERRREGGVGSQGGEREEMGRREGRREGRERGSSALLTIGTLL